MLDQPTAFPLLVVVGRILTLLFACVIGPQWLGFAVTTRDRQGKHLWVARLAGLVSGASYFAVIFAFFWQESDRMQRAGEICATPIMILLMFALVCLPVHIYLAYEFAKKRIKLKQDKSPIAPPIIDPSLPPIIE